MQQFAVLRDDGNFYCSPALCEHFGTANHLNTRAYCRLYKKYLSGSAASGKKVKACADCKKAILARSREANRERGTK